MADSPDIRVGTDEREQALTTLTEHFAAGRLSVAEFDERSAAINAAVTRGEIDTLFTDLPAQRKEADVVPAKARGAWDWRAVVIGLTPILALVLFFVFDTWLWFLLIPAVAIVVEGGKRVLD